MGEPLYNKYQPNCCMMMWGILNYPYDEDSPSDCEMF